MAEKQPDQTSETRAPASMLPPHVMAFYQKAEENLEGFWEEAALSAKHDLHWFRKWDKVLEQNYPTFKWYSGRQDQHLLQRPRLQGEDG